MIRRIIIPGVGRGSRSCFGQQARRWQSDEAFIHDIESKDPFKILGVTRQSSEEEVNSNYKKLAMKYHPDRPTGSEELFNKLREAKEMVLIRLGEKIPDDDSGGESVDRHDGEYTYNEESTEWEYKRGKVRVYDDYVDTHVERQRMGIWVVQGIMGAWFAWILFENYIEEFFTEVVSDDGRHKEGRMFANAKRREYEKEAENQYMRANYGKGSSPSSTYTETFIVEDPFSPSETRQQLSLNVGWLPRLISWIEYIMPTLGRWLRFLWIPDTVRVASYG
eukprot:TRINITY_DN8980_c0_g1_i1.p1 TRINITY_DN8980_c0_g1~~TRINITY_DN8980_c0_g1_i1.p1  ORF type:complete len:278 (+),score=56.40 TRINITY_DN8980_c0_g1_i1:49-882(+)